MEQHIWVPHGCPHQAGQCLLWGCKACKKQSSSGDLHQAAMLREQRCLQKVNQAFEAFKCCTATSPGQHLPKVEILHSAICHIEGLQHLRRRHCFHPPVPSSSEPTSPTSSATVVSPAAALPEIFDSSK
ncbi:UNVERIFIED_CONTAM: hypothetical protein K2H54_028861 [Gekko kuhli]